MNTSRFSEIRVFLKRHGLRIFLPLLLLLLTYMSYTISREPVSSGLDVTSRLARYLLPAVALLSIVLAALKLYSVSLSLFIGYHLGVVFAMIGTEKREIALLIVALSLVISLLLGAWLEVFSVLLARWKREAERD